MSSVKITKGTNMHDGFIIPTIRYNGNTLGVKFLTIEWLSWYFGIKWE